MKVNGVYSSGELKKKKKLLSFIKYSINQIDRLRVGDRNDQAGPESLRSLAQYQKTQLAENADKHQSYYCNAYCRDIYSYSRTVRAGQSLGQYDPDNRQPDYNLAFFYRCF